MVQSNLQHQCQTRAARVRHEQHKCDTSVTLATRVRHERHKCDTSATRTTRVRHECYTNDTSATQVKHFDFDNDTSKNIYSHPYGYYMESERLQREEQSHSKNQLLEMLCSHAKIRLKSAPQKLNFLVRKLYQKVIHQIVAANVLARFRIVTHSNAVSISIKTILCENTNAFQQELLKTR